MEDTAAYKSAVNGWRQAIGIVDAQHIAIEWLIFHLNLARDGRLPNDERTARDYAQTVLSARKTGADYLEAMRQADAALLSR